MLSKHGLVNTMSIEKKQTKNDDMTRLLVISLGNIFAYILEKKCATENTLDAPWTKKHNHLLELWICWPHLHI